MVDTITAWGGQGRLLRRRRRGRGLPRRAQAPDRPPAGRLQLAGVVQHRRHGRAAAGQRLPALRRARHHARGPGADRPAGRGERGGGQGVRRPRRHQGRGGKATAASRCSASTPRPATSSTSPPTTWCGGRSGDGTGRFVPAGELRPGDQLEWHRTESYGEGEIDLGEVAEAALAGWLQADGFVGQYEGTNRSLTIEAMTVTEAEQGLGARRHRPRLPRGPPPRARVVTPDEQPRLPAHPSLRATPSPASSSAGTCWPAAST